MFFLFAGIATLSAPGANSLWFLVSFVFFSSESQITVNNLEKCKEEN